MSRMKPQPVKKANPFASLGMVQKAKSVPQTRNVAAAKPAMPLPGMRIGGATSLGMIQKQKSTPKTRSVPAAKPSMPAPPSGFRKGGSTKRKMSKKY